MIERFNLLWCAVWAHRPEDKDQADGRHCARCGKLLSDEELNDAMEPI